MNKNDVRLSKKDVDAVNKFFAKWVGAGAAFNRYIDDHDRLIVKLVSVSNPSEIVGVTFGYCTYLSGRTRWGNSKIECSICELGDGENGFELRDDNVGFVLRCYGPIVFGDDGRVIPST
jgi:hypothetical protein